MKKKKSIKINKKFYFIGAILLILTFILPSVVSFGDKDAIVMSIILTLSIGFFIYGVIIPDPDSSDSIYYKLDKNFSFQAEGGRELTNNFKDNNLTKERKTMKMIDLNAKRQEITDVATEIFEKFVNMPQDVRPDDKERTGIQVLVWQPGTRNLVLVSVKEPSEAARFFAIEKAVREDTHGHYSSENSAEPKFMMFAGSISLQMDEIPGFEELGHDAVLTASTSGLKAEEDVAVSAAILAKLTGLSIDEICENVNFNDGVLPDWYYDEDKGYFQFLFE
jgi:hypothetical protein